MTTKAENKEKSHAAIRLSAATLLRERGISASSVMDVMKGAGLTVGGFYGHFASKEALFADTIRHEIGGMWKRLIVTAKGETARERVLNFVKRYASRDHRDNPAQGCLLPSTVAEVAKEGEPYRSALEGRLADFSSSLAELLAGASPHDNIDNPHARHTATDKQRALGLIALMYGAVSLSRALAGTSLSDEFLLAARKLAQDALPESP